MNICPIDLIILQQAIELNFSDFEDAVQYACALAWQVNAIVTRDVSGFTASQIRVVSPDELRELLSK